MPTKKGKGKVVGSAMMGSGRVLGSGEVVPGVGGLKKKEFQDLGEEEYTCSSDSDPSDDSGGSSLAEEDLDLDLDYVEVKQIDGSYVKEKMASAKSEKEMAEDLKAVVEKDLERLDRNAKRGRARLGQVIIRAQANSKMVGDKELDVSDEANAKATSKSVKFVLCKEGIFQETKPKDGVRRYKPIKKEKLEKMDADKGNSSPCHCEVCLARVKNSLKAVAPGTSRSGKKRDGFNNKYGEGRVLDGGSA